MFAPLSPILAADDGADAHAQVVRGQFESMTPVLAVIARLAGVAPQARAGLLEQSADLSAVLASLPPEQMRFAAEQFGFITGRVALDEVLDVVFRDFCIGK